MVWRSGRRNIIRIRLSDIDRVQNMVTIAWSSFCLVLQVWGVLVIMLRDIREGFVYREGLFRPSKRNVVKVWALGND